MTDVAKPDASRRDERPAGRAEHPTPGPHRRPPPMRVVTKGWWTLEEKETDIKELEKEGRRERKQG